MGQRKANCWTCKEKEGGRERDRDRGRIREVLTKRKFADKKCLTRGKETLQNTTETKGMSVGREQEDW